MLSTILRKCSLCFFFWFLQALWIPVKQGIDLITGLAEHLAFHIQYPPGMTFSTRLDILPSGYTLARYSVSGRIFGQISGFWSDTWLKRPLIDFAWGAPEPFNRCCSRYFDFMVSRNGPITSLLLLMDTKVISFKVNRIHELETVSPPSPHLHVKSMISFCQISGKYDIQSIPTNKIEYELYHGSYIRW